MNRFRKGLALEIIGVIILLAGLILRQVLREEHKTIDTEYAVLLVLAMGLLAGGGAIYMMGRKLRVRLAKEVLKPGEPYILYLRSFASEEATARLATADPWILQL